VNTADLTGAGILTDTHTRNFLDCIRGTAKEQSSPVEPGHASTLLCHLGNIAYRIGETVACNPTNGHVKGAKAQALWGRDYQSGWDLKA